jgi:acyl carrier protein
MSDTVARVIPIVAKQLDRDPSEFSADTNLEEAGYASLDVIETIFAVEEEFGIDVDFNANVEGGPQIKTIGDLAALIDRELAARPAA